MNSMLQVFVLLTTTPSTSASTSTGTTSAGGSFIATVFDGISAAVRGVGSGIVTVLGVLLIIVAVMQIVKAFVSRSGTNWLMTFGCLFFGGVLAIGGWKMFSGGLLGKMGKETMDDIGFAGQNKAGAYNTGDVGKGLDILAQNYFLPFGKMLAVCAGAALVTIAVYHVAMYFMKGRIAISWVKVIAIGVLGSCLFGADPKGGWGWVTDSAVGVFRNVVEDLPNKSEADQEADPISASALNQAGAGSSSGTTPSTPTTPAT